jgi:hypothetical protein
VLLFALAGLLGGTLGNAVDRVVLGQVTYFLDFHWRGYYRPAFTYTAPIASAIPPSKTTAITATMAGPPFVAWVIAPGAAFSPVPEHGNE